MGDVCQPFYYKALGIDLISSKRRALRVRLMLLNIQPCMKATKIFRTHDEMTSHCRLPHGPPASFRPSQRASKLLRGDCLYREKRCLFPWASLFIWAVLQNRSEMATFFWEMVNLQRLTKKPEKSSVPDAFSMRDMRECVCSDFPRCLLQAGESVLSALSGCKMLREISKVEIETETKLSMKELAQKFENLAHGEILLVELCPCVRLLE